MKKVLKIFGGLFAVIGLLVVLLFVYVAIQLHTPTQCKEFYTYGITEVDPYYTTRGINITSAVATAEKEFEAKIGKDVLHFVTENPDLSLIISYDADLQRNYETQYDLIALAEAMDASITEKEKAHEVFRTTVEESVARFKVVKEDLDRTFASLGEARIAYEKGEMSQVEFETIGKDTLAKQAIAEQMSTATKDLIAKEQVMVDELNSLRHSRTTHQETLEESHRTLFGTTDPKQVSFRVRPFNELMIEFLYDEEDLTDALIRGLTMIIDTNDSKTTDDQKVLGSTPTPFQQFLGVNDSNLVLSICK